MGLTFTKLFSRLFAKKEMRILMVGLDAAGSLIRIKMGLTFTKLFSPLFAKEEMHAKKKMRILMVGLDAAGVIVREMGSEAPKNVVIHVTGFKKFNVFATNPTETLVANLKSYVEKTGLPPGVSLGSCTILETAGDGALDTLKKVLEASVSSENKSGSTEVVWLHMGLNGGASKFAIERQAVNEATFSCPDELGWQPKRLPIVADDGEITRIRETPCSVDAILEFLKSIKGCDAVISDDAGRFVCNYVYYHSLRFAEEKGHKSLFVHVPPFSRINEEAQMQFMVSLLEAIASTC